MFILIVGGGKVGRYLINDFQGKGHKLVLIEQEQSKVERISQRFDIEVVCGDGAARETLEKAGIEGCDVVLAVTENDQDNLAICHLAERQYHIPRTFTRVNNPGNERLFNWLGVNVAVSDAAILAALVEREVRATDLVKLLIKDQEKLKLLRLTVAEESPVIDRKIKDIDLPQEAVLVTILRGNTPIVPRGTTRIKGRDLILALTRPELKDELLNTFNGG